jgi:signal transduction histidine kinase
MGDDQTLDITQRVREKKDAYRRYNFERLQEEAFATFFDLAQEFTHLEALFQICVAVPKEFFGMDSCLYLVQPRTLALEKVCSSEQGLISGKARQDVAIRLAEESYETERAWVFTIRGNRALMEWMQLYGQGHTLGMFEIYPKDKIDNKSHFFFTKFANRIGYNLHQKLLIKQNLEHIKFINQLVSDIEHNVISPNMYYKLFIRRLGKHLNTYENIFEKLGSTILFCTNGQDSHCNDLREIYQSIGNTNEKLQEDFHAFTKHYEHTSLFLETLLRRDHFERGTYVLRRHSCNFRTEILEPLLERYRPMFHKKGIAINDNLEGIPDEEMTLFVDKGLISQVFDNFLGNAVKYTQEVVNEQGGKMKFISYNRRILRNHFGEGVHGVKFSFFTTGKPISGEELEHLFEEGFRSKAAGAERGTGHGLHFVRNVVEIHGGQVGCTPQRYGNDFFFILPLKEKVPWGTGRLEGISMERP